MRISDLMDFVNYSVVNITFEDIFPDDIKTDDHVVIALDSASRKYYLELKGRRYDIKPTYNEDMHEMDSYIANPGIYIKCYVGNIDANQKTTYIYLYKFGQYISIAAHGKLKIKVPDSIMSKVPKKVDNIVSYLRNLFILEGYNGSQEVFAIKKMGGTEEEDFVLVCGKRRLNIRHIGNEYVVTSLVNFNRSDSPMIVMGGAVEFVDETQNARINDAVADCLSSAVDEGKYTAIWKKYDDLESLICARKAIDSGVYKYKSYSTYQTDVITYDFELTDNRHSENIDDAVDLDITDNPDIMDFYNQDSLDAEKASKLISTIKGQFVGRFAKFDKNKLYIESDSDFTPKKLPHSGYIYKSLQGDIKRMSRRNEAQHRINSGQAALPNLAMLLNDGISAQKSYSDYAPITEEVTRQLTNDLGEKIEFNDSQREAIRIAINTPDIALIQGPPGTGKTTVIRAIVARFVEIYKKNYHGKLPRVLITSFQHDAVENAIAKMDTLGLPANRVGGKREELEKRKAVITSWIENTIKRLDNDIDNLTDPTLYKIVEEIRMCYFAWIEKGKDYEEGIEILKKYNDNNVYDFSAELQVKISILISKNESGSNVVKLTPEKKEIAALITKQRLTSTAFSDDGIINLRNLIDQMEFFEADFETPSFIENVISSEGSDQLAFIKYVAFIEELRNKYSVMSISDCMYDIGDIDWCISELIAQKENAIVARVENINEAKAKILIEYKQCLYSETEEIVKNYASVQASTCQQTMETGRFASNEPFDLVIVDEAARANPSDLFIPLCMGSRIVLVGDQRQLPHMLDPDTLKELMANTDDKTIAFYQQSLFERLFEILEENDQRNTGVKHTCSLTDQYRMITDISDFVRDKIYMPKVNLTCKTSRQPYSIADYRNKAMVWINAGKTRGYESKTRSKYRECEIDLIFIHLKKLLTSSANIKSIGIITFYAEQRDRILRRLDNIGLTADERDMMEVGTIDAFQGKEFDVVMFSCSRCNDLSADELQKKVGFLNDDNRMCVALSRGRNLLLGFGDEETVLHAKILGEYIQECKTGKGCYIDA